MNPYDKQEAAAYSATRTTWPEVTEFLLKYIHSANFLDTGCGTGNDLFTIYQKTGFIGYGCDNSKDMLSHAKKKLPSAKLVQANLDAIFPFDQLFDVIYMHDVIHHLKTPVFFLQNIFTHLSVNGVFILGSEFQEGLRHKYMLPYFPSAYKKDSKRYPSYTEISNQLNQIGLETIEKLVITHDQPFTKEVLIQIRTKSHSILRLLPEEEFTAGLATIEKDFENDKLKTVSNDYTLIACKKQPLFVSL